MTRADIFMANQTARTAMLRTIRDTLASSPPDRHSAGHGTAPQGSPVHGTSSANGGGPPHRVDQDTLLATFQSQLTALGATSACVPTVAQDAAEIQAALRAYHDAATTAGILSGSLRVGYSDAAVVNDAVTALDAQEPMLATLQPFTALSRDALFALDVGITGVQWGVAETGTLVISTAAERNRLLSLIPALHVAIVSRSAIQETLAEVLAEIHEDSHPSSSTASTLYSASPRPMPDRAVTLITGPSRTSDIELTLVIGVHGPRQLHVIVLDDISPRLS